MQIQASLLVLVKYFVQLQSAQMDLSSWKTAQLSEGLVLLHVCFTGRTWLHVQWKSLSSLRLVLAAAARHPHVHILVCIHQFHAHTFIHTHAYMNMRSYACMYTHMHMQALTHACTHMQAHQHKWGWSEMFPCHCNPGMVCIFRSSAEAVVCPGGSVQCADGQTCCKLPTGEYGCCPFSQVWEWEVGGGVFERKWAYC